MIHPDNQRFMSERIKPRKTVELAASHASLASQPGGAVVDLIDDAVAELG